MDRTSKAGKWFRFRRQASRVRPPPTEDEIDAATQEDRGDLGDRTIDGVAAQGREYAIVVPAGSHLGNTKPLEQIVKQWTSAELQVPILVETQSPISGKTTRRFYLDEIGVEQPRDLFVPPADYDLSEASIPKR